MEDLHTTSAPPEVTIYPEHLAEFAGPRTAPARPGEAILDISLRSAILTACDELAEASARYTAASAGLAEAAIALHERRMQLQYTEDRETARATGVLTGRNAEERKAQLADLLWDVEDVDLARSERDGALAAHTRVEHDFRAADIAQKALRARLYALTALLGRS